MAASRRSNYVVLQVLFGLRPRGLRVTLLSVYSPVLEVFAVRGFAIEV